MRVAMSFSSFVQLYGYLVTLAKGLSFTYEVRASKVRGWVDFTLFDSMSEKAAVACIENYMYTHLA